MNVPTTPTEQTASADARPPLGSEPTAVTPTRGLPLSERLVLLGWTGLLFLPLFAASGYQVRLGTMAAIGAVFALSLNLLFGYAGQISFGHAGFYAVGAYAAAISSTVMPLPVAVVLAVILSAIVAVLVGYPILRLKEHYLGMATLAFGLLVFAVARQWISVTGGPSGRRVGPRDLFGLELTAATYHVLVMLLLFATYVFLRQLVSSKAGWAMRALRADEKGAASVGVPVTRYKVLAFSLAGALAGLAGALYSYLDRFIAPETFGLHKSILVVTMVVVGGLGSNIGAVLGGAVLILMPEVLHRFNEAEQLFYGALLLLFLLFLPGGLMSLRPPTFLRRRASGGDG